MEASEADYGEFYWCIKTKLSKDGEIFAYADDAKILPDGTLVLLRMRKDVPEINMSISAGNWQAIYAAHVHDSAPFAITQWAGEVGGGRTRTPIYKSKVKN